MDEGRDRGSKLGSFLDPDPWKILWIQIQIRQNDLDPLDPDPQHCANVFMILPRYSLLQKSPQRYCLVIVQKHFILTTRSE